MRMLVAREAAAADGVKIMGAESKAKSWQKGHARCSCGQARDNDGNG